MERFDWKARAVQRKNSRKSWDAVRQFARYSEVVGIDEPILVQAVEDNDLFRDEPPPPEKPSESN